MGLTSVKKNQVTKSGFVNSFFSPPSFQSAKAGLLSGIHAFPASRVLRGVERVAGVTWVSSRWQSRAISQLSFSGIHYGNHPVPGGNQLFFYVVLVQNIKHLLLYHDSVLIIISKSSKEKKSIIKGNTHLETRILVPLWRSGVYFYHMTAVLYILPAGLLHHYRWVLQQRGTVSRLDGCTWEWDSWGQRSAWWQCCRPEPGCWQMSDSCWSCWPPVLLLLRRRWSWWHWSGVGWSGQYILALWSLLWKNKKS